MENIADEFLGTLKETIADTNQKLSKIDSRLNHIE